MVRLAIDHFLTEFGEGDGSQPQHEAGIIDFDALFASPAQPALSFSAPAPVDLEAETEAAYQRGLAEGREAAEAELDARLAAVREEAQAELAQARAAWVGETADSLVQQIGQGLDSLRHQIADVLADVLQPVLHARARARAVDDLLAELNALSAEQQGLRLEIAGPADLLADLRTRLPATGFDIAWRENEQPEIAISAGSTALNTRLQHWLERLQEQAA